MRLASFVLACGISAMGCSEAKPRAPYLAGDCTAHCAFGPPSTSGLPDGGGRPIPTLADGGGSSSLTGTVSVFRDLLFDTTDTFVGDGVVKVLGTHLVSGTLAGTNFFVDHTDFAKTLWVGIHATPTAGSLALLDTVTSADGTGPEVAVSFGKTSVMTEIAALVSPIPPALTAPPLDPNAAHVVVRFVDGSGSKVPGVQLALKTGVLYDVQGSYADTGVTASRGTAIIVNVTPPGAPLPGAPVSFQYQTLTSTTALKFVVYVAPAALTITTVVVPS